MNAKNYPQIDRAAWQGRVKRVGERFTQKIYDLERDVDWNILGGKRYFTRYLSETLGAHKWCFIVGCNNSGTSLLQSIFEKSEQVSTFKYEGQRYTNVLARATKRGYERVWTEYLNELAMTKKDSLEHVPRLAHDWMRELSLPINEIIVEKTTANAVRMGWLQEAFPNSYFIGLVRNGYAVTEGIIRKGNKSVERGARHWNMVNKIMVQDSAHVDRYLEVRYEDLVDSPVATAKIIADYIGLSHEKIQSAMVEEYEFNTVLGGHKQQVTNLNIAGITRLSENDLSKIEEEATEMLNYFGYTPDIN